MHWPECRLIHEDKLLKQGILCEMATDVECSFLSVRCVCPACDHLLDLL